MKYDKLLVKCLYAFFFGLFWVFIFFLSLVLLGNLRSDGRVFGSSKVTPHYSSGFQVPIKVRISIPDSIVTWDGEKGRVDRTYFENDDSRGYTYESKDEVGKIVNRVKIRKNLHSDETLSFNPESRTEISGHTYIRSSDKYTQWFYNLATLIQILIVAIILYLLKSIFYLFSQSFSFSFDMVKRVRWLGYFLVGYALFMFMIDRSIYKLINSIVIESFENDIRIMKPFSLSIHTYVDFDWTFFLMGISVIVLSSLLKMGSSIQLENDLTI